MGRDGDDTIFTSDGGRWWLVVTSVSELPVSSSVGMGTVVERVHGCDGVLTLIRVSCHLGGEGTLWWGWTSCVSYVCVNVSTCREGTVVVVVDLVYVSSVVPRGRGDLVQRRW